MWTARLFDGVSPVPLWCRLEVSQGNLHLWPANERYVLCRQVAQSDADLIAAGICLENGIHLQVVDEPEAFVRAVRMQGLPMSRFEHLVERTMATWPPTVLCMLVLLGSLLCLDQWVLPSFALVVAKQVPHELQDQIGQAAMGQLERKGYTRLYQRSDDPVWLATDFMSRVYKFEPTLKFRIHMLKPPKPMELNAFALPGGHIGVFTTLLDTLNHDELSAVAAHELGHVKHRHGMQQVAKVVGLSVIASLTVGDFSTVASTLAVAGRSMAYSREMEEEADRYAVDLLRQLEIPPESLGHALEKLVRNAHEQGGQESVPLWLSTHPRPTSRIEKVMQAK